MPRSVLLVLALLAGALGFGPSSLLRGSRAHSACRRAVVPLLSADGVGTSEVRWLAPLDPTDPESAPSAGAMVMPLFPLGVTYLPYTSPVLNIFEPRYRAMYNDILFSGARRFMVCNVDSETGRMAEVGVIFYLDELKEVSEQTQDRVKYIGSHSVIGRAQLNKVLNPSVAATRKSYLRAEVTELRDSDAAGNAATANAEAELLKMFENLVDMQAELKEEPRFTEAVKGTLAFGPGTGKEDKGLWGTIVLWQQFLEQRAQVVGNKMQREIQKKVVDFLQRAEESDFDRSKLVNSRGEVRLEDLPEELTSEIRSIQRRYREELEASESDPYGLQFQALLQAETHAARLKVFERVLDVERKRLSARVRERQKIEPGPPLPSPSFQHGAAEPTALGTSERESARMTLIRRRRCNRSSKRMTDVRWEMQAPRGSIDYTGDTAAQHPSPSARQVLTESEPTLT